jgi:hypothetical protein
MKKVVAWLSVLGGVSAIVLSVPLTGCNGGSCSYVSKCPNDPAPTADDTTLCTNRENDSNCGGAYSDYLGCIQQQQTCTETGVTDETITNGLCGDKYAKWQDCYFGIDGGAYADASAE